MKLFTKIHRKMTSTNFLAMIALEQRLSTSGTRITNDLRAHLVKVLSGDKLTSELES